jgi:hypothetical protein
MIEESGRTYGNGAIIGTGGCVKKYGSSGGQEQAEELGNSRFAVVRPSNNGGDGDRDTLASRPVKPNVINNHGGT